MRRTPLVLLLGLLVALVVGSSLRTTGFSDAAYVRTSTNTATVTAAADWTPPTVTAGTPVTPVQGVVSLTATASDAESGIASVTLQFLAPGASTWTTVCTTATAPYGCSWDTRTGADGTYDIRARATNGAGYTTVSDSVRATVANSVVVVLADPGDVVRGTIPLSASVYSGGALPWLVTIQYVASGGTNWKPLCSGLSAPFSCSWPTTTATNDSFDLRAVATSGTTSVTSAVVPDVLVDNGAPVVTMTDPGTPLSGTTTFAATATDAVSGVGQVVLQYAPANGGYQTFCTLTVDPYSCRFATTALPDGSYSFRAVATDVAGNTATSAVVANRVVDNTVSSVSLDDPGAYLTGTATVTAAASSSVAITSVRIQRAPTGTSTWTDLCTDTTAPYSCSWDTRTVADGSYDLRALLLDARGVTTTSAVISARRVDNSPLRGLDVQTGNGDGTLARVDAGDSMTLTYSQQVNPASVFAGWTGAATAVTLRLRDGNLVGGGNKTDTVDVLRSGTALPLGSVNLREDYVKTRKTVTFNATMTATTVTTADGAVHTVITIVVGTVASGTGLKTAVNPSTMTWSPSATVTSTTGTACSTAPATESGAGDREF
jgi:hypothetical protein